jgi:hypothetical protein
VSTLTRQAYGMWFDDVTESGGAMPPLVDFTGNVPSGMISILSTAKSRGVRCILKITGGPNQSKDAAGHFSMESWENKLDDAYVANQVQQVHNFVLDGTLLGNLLTDDAKAGSPVWNGVPPTLDQMDHMAFYSKSKWSMLPTIMRIDNAYLADNKSDWTQLDTAWCQWHSRFGAALPWMTNNVNKGKVSGLGTIIAFNLLHGGSGDTEPWTYTGSGGQGTGAVMSPMEIDAITGAVSVLTTSVGVFGWAAGDGPFDTTDFYTNGSGIQAALGRLAAASIGKTVGPINWRGDMPWMNPGSSVTTGGGSSVTVIGSWTLVDGGLSTVARGNNVTTLTVPAPEVYFPGNLHCLLAHSRDSARSFSQPSGWSVAKSVSGNSAQGGQLVLYYKIGGATEADVGLVSSGGGATPAVNVTARRFVFSNNSLNPATLLAGTGSAKTWASKTGMGPIAGMSSSASDALVLICAARCDDFGGGSVDEDVMSATTGPQNWLRLFATGSVSGSDDGFFVDAAATAGIESIDTKSWTQLSGSAAGAGAGFMVAFAPVSIVTGQPAQFTGDFDDITMTLGSDLSFRLQSIGSTPRTYSKTSGPSNMTVGSSTGLVEYSPLTSGVDVCRFTVSNAFGSDTDGFSITVSSSTAAQNVAPVITHPGNFTIRSQSLLAFGLEATDADGDTLEYDLDVGGATGASIHPDTGQFLWTPSGNQHGIYPMVALVSDGNFLSRSTFTVNVTDNPWVQTVGPNTGSGSNQSAATGFRRSQ